MYAETHRRRIVMTKKKGFGKPVPLHDDIPSHLRGGKTVPSILVNRSVDDYAWLGDDGNWNPQRVLDDLIAPAALLRLVVQAIVAGNPSPANTPEDRIEKAMRALLGKKGVRGRRNLSSDAPILNRMADEYLRGFYGFKDSHPSLNALADWALRNEPGFAEGSEEWRENRRRTISRKFQKHQDRLLAEFASSNDMEIQEALAGTRAVLKALDDLGIRLQMPG
jgi:hypothetical protein